MNTIGSLVGWEKTHGEGYDVSFNGNYVELKMGLKEAYNVDMKSHETHQHQGGSSEKHTKNIYIFNSLVQSNRSEQELSKKEDNLPLDLSIARKNDLCYGEDNKPSSSFQIKKAKDLLLQTQHGFKLKKNNKPHHRRNASHKARSRDEQCSIVLEACHPYSNCSKVAKIHDIPHQYIFAWCKKHFSMSITELKKILEYIYQNPSPNQIPFLALDTIIHSSELEKKRKIFTTLEKEKIIQEACGIKNPVYEVAKHYNIGGSIIHRWCREIHNMTLENYRKNRL